MKHALVTGSSSGIGKAITEALLADGWRVQGTSRHRPDLDHARFSWLSTDFISKYQASRLGNVADRLAPSLDALVHCAATYGEDAPLAESDPDDWARTITVNLAAAYHVVRATLPALRRADDPRVLLFSGGGAFDPHPGRSAYAASKAGIVSLASTLAEEERGQIAVNCVAPGFVPTPMTGHPDMPSPEKDRAVACVLHLLSPSTRGLTGKTISAPFDDWQQIGPHNVESLNGSLLGERHRYRVCIPEPALVAV